MKQKSAQSALLLSQPSGNANTWLSQEQWGSWRLDNFQSSHRAGRHLSSNVLEQKVFTDHQKPPVENLGGGDLGGGLHVAMVAVPEVSYQM